MDDVSALLTRTSPNVENQRDHATEGGEETFPEIIQECHVTISLPRLRFSNDKNL